MPCVSPTRLEYAQSVQKREIAAGVKPFGAIDSLHPVSIAVVEELGQIAAIGVDSVWRQIALLA